MKITRSTALLLAVTAFGATAATAQSASDPAQATSPAPTAQAPAAAPLTNADVTDSDVNQFATAVLAVQKIESDASVADSDKQTKMAAAVKDSGMTPEKFNAIAKASQSDPALMKRIQTAAAAQMQASPDTGSAGGAAGSR
jgi:GH25 family lysozyme M1 (1,4-beta-N-acetylmuramidase)